MVFSGWEDGLTQPLLNIITVVPTYYMYGQATNNSAPGYTTVTQDVTSSTETTYGDKSVSHLVVL